MKANSPNSSARPAPARVTNKLIRDVLALRLARLGPMPCGCTPHLASCSCPPTACECEMEVVLCEHEHLWADDDASSEGMPDEVFDHWSLWDQAAEADVQAIDRQLFEILSAIDRENYRILPRGGKAARHVSRGDHLDAMGERLESGLSPFESGAGDDIEAAALKFGAVLHNARNGATQFLSLDGGSSSCPQP